MAPILKFESELAPENRHIDGLFNPDDPAQLDPLFLHGFWKSISMILVSEIADKTFFIAAIMSANNPRLTVYAGCILALIVMTMLSVAVGNIAMQFLPVELTDLIASILFLLFGLHALYEGFKMKVNDDTEFRETQMELKEREERHELTQTSSRRHTSGGNNSVNSSDEVDRCQSIQKMCAIDKCWSSVNLSDIFNRIFLQAFGLTFLAEWGDRSQFATIILASQNNAYGVCLGGIIGHMICTGIAVLGGRFLAQKVDPKYVTIVGALVFLGFAGFGLGQMFYPVNKFEALAEWVKSI